MTRPDDFNEEAPRRSNQDPQSSVVLRLSSDMPQDFQGGSNLDFDGDATGIAAEHGRLDIPGQRGGGRILGGGTQALQGRADNRFRAITRPRFGPRAGNYRVGGSFVSQPI